MNIVNKLTWRHMMQNKRRTLVTIIGVIISVSMITAVATLTESFINFVKNEHIANEGEWHVTYRDVNLEQLESIKADKNSKEIILSEEFGYSLLEESENPFKPYIFVKHYNDIGFKQIPMEVITGRLPENDQELVISEHLLTNGNVELSIGDQITLDIGERISLDEHYTDYYLGQTFGLISGEEEVLEKIETTETREYTIVGVIERPTWEPYQAPGYTAISYMSEESIKSDQSIDASVVWNKVSKSNLEHAKNLGKTLGIEEIVPNESLLRYYGISRHEFLLGAVYSVVSIIMTVIIIGSVSLIYNAFAISVSERSQHLGMLSSVGATKKQKRNSILFEGAVIGLFSIPFGLLSGIGGIAVTLTFINSILQRFDDFKTDLTVHVTPFAIIIAIAVAILTIFISAYIPAVRASRISAIDAIRQAKDIKLTRKKVKTSKIVRKLFGMEAEIALKNLKRHKKRYYATVFSLVVSIVLFLTVSFLTEQIRATSYAVISDINYEILISPITHNGAFEDDLIQSINSLEDVTQLTELNYAYFDTQLKEEQLHESMLDQIIDGKASVFIGLYAPDEATLRAYAKDVGVDYETLTNTDRLSGILINTMASPGEKIGQVTSVYMEPGEQVNLTYNDWDKGTDVEITSIELAALTDKRPHGIDIPIYASTTSMIVSQEVFDIINSIYNIENHKQIVISSSDPLKTQEELEKLVGTDMNIFNYHSARQEEEGMVLIMSIFGYGFISLITLISIANIFNTISTSISLRTREFGMLKSIGMTPKGFRRMINYESIFYGIKALLFGLPISFGIMYLIYRELAGAFDYPLELPWMSIIGVIAGVFLIVGLAMLYASSKVKKANIIDALRSENI